jgi:hypothetical protein
MAMARAHAGMTGEIMACIFLEQLHILLIKNYA